MESLKLIGEYRIESLNVKTGERRLSKIHNLILQNLYTSIFQFLDYTAQTPAASLIDLQYFAIGDGTTGPVKADTTLENEIYRKQYATKTFGASQFNLVTSILPADGNPSGGIIKEVGVFANGTAAADSGLLISRASVEIQKNVNIQLNINWKFTLSEG